MKSNDLVTLRIRCITVQDVAPPMWGVGGESLLTPRLCDPKCSRPHP